jgi:transposase
MPLATLVVPGDVADDGLYIPVIKEAQAVLQQSGRLYVGDSTMEALQTRAYLAHCGDYYLTPLSQQGTHQELLVTQVIAAAQHLMGWRLYATNAPSQQLPLAQAVSVYRSAPRIERNFLRWKGRPLRLRPLHVQRRRPPSRHGALVVLGLAGPDPDRIRRPSETATRQRKLARLVSR